jgi:hypothetical protein
MGGHLTSLTRRTYYKHSRDLHPTGCIVPTAFMLGTTGRREAAVVAQITAQALGCDLTKINVMSLPVQTLGARDKLRLALSRRQC